MIFRVEQHLSFSRVSLAACLSATCCFAGWFGAGVAGGTGGTNINDTANWTGSVVNGDFSGITAEGTTALALTNDIVFADGSTQTRTEADLSFASNATEIVFVNVDGIEVGQTVNGANVYSNTFLIALTDTNGTLSRATSGVSSGTYTFVRPALNFNFGVLGSRATNVTVTIGSEPVGTTRILSLNGRLCQSQNATPTNQVVFSSDIVFTCAGAVSVTREDGAITTNGIPPLVTVNGPVALGDVGSITTRLTLDGGSLTLTGVVSGVNARLNVCSSTNASTLTLLNPENSFSGGLTTARGGALVANASRVLANAGLNSALGSGGSIDLNDTYCTLQGFTARQSTDRPWNTGGYGFPALSGGSGGTLQRLSGQQTLPTTGYNVNSNYILNVAGTVTPEADPNFATLTVDTTAGATALALGARKIACNGAGRGLLFSGPNDATLSGTGTASHVSAASLWFHNYLETNATLYAALNLGAGGPHVLWGGTGFAVYSGAGLGNNFHLAGGVFRVTAPQTLAFPGKIFVLASGGVFEIGADLNGGAAGDFNCPVGAPGAATTNVALYGDTGLSAAGANRTVNFGGAGAMLTWGASRFLTFYDGITDYGYTFKLSSPYSDATVEIQNPIDLNGNGLHGRIRTVEVANGSAAVDARLSGTLSGNAALAKSGPGTLELTGAQTYDGPLIVLDGMLRTGADNLFADTLTVQLRGGGLAAGSGTNAFGPLELYTNTVIDAGDGTASLAFADSSACA